MNRKIILSFVLILVMMLSAVDVYADDTPTQYPWSKVVATGDYIADAYNEVESGHVFESVTQERLQDILSSKGNYYIVFGGPNQETSQKVLDAINQQAKADGITKIYHFDPFIDGYQVDISDAAKTWKATQPVYDLWTRITSFLPQGAPVSDYTSKDTLLFLYNRNETTPGSRGTIKSYYQFRDTNLQDDYSVDTEKSKIKKVFRGSNTAADSAAVIKSSVRTDLAFFNRIYNASATRIEGQYASESRIGAAVTLFDGLTDANFKLHQINFTELQNLYNTPGEHIIFYGASWCHNTQSIIGAIAKAAAVNTSLNTVYVYDTTLGNQQTFGTGDRIDVSLAGPSTYNSRASASDNGVKNNVSYMYAEAVRPLGNFTTQNLSYQEDSIAYFPNGDLASSLTSAEPWATADAPKNANRLQLPFLLAYDNSAENPAIRQWLHKQKNGKYIEYMLELAWVRGTDLAKADTTIYGNGGVASDTNQTRIEVAAEAVNAIKSVLPVYSGSSDPGEDDTTGNGGNTGNSGNNGGSNGGTTGNTGNNGNSGKGGTDGTTGNTGSNGNTDTGTNPTDGSGSIDNGADGTANPTDTTGNNDINNIPISANANNTIANGNRPNQPQNTSNTNTNAKPKVANTADEASTPAAIASNDDLEADALDDIDQTEPIPETADATDDTGIAKAEPIDIFADGIPVQIIVAIALVALVAAGIILDKKGLLIKGKAVTV